MIKMGMMIGERYEILEPIGTGGMSDVYKAKCHKLNRFVAVKVLKQEFSENTEFVSKFRTEAQAAAGLMHSNIVNVYDVGEENGIYYIVMELVEGITLKRYIEKKARLSVKEAVSIAIQISMGIEAAHNNGIIHRDIKPQNIIISREGKVKVTDFGIAKAATSNTITSNVMGSVHYTSPEQARGGFSDEKSDIYSLGITLFEMLTGRVPFNGETTVAIAIKHIQEDMPSPRNYVPEIPISVEQIVLKCTQKSPDRRYQKMPELVEDLKKSLISPNEDFVKIESVEKKGVTRMVSDSERQKIKEEVKRQTGPISAAAANGIALQNQTAEASKRSGVDESASPIRQRRPVTEGEPVRTGRDKSREELERAKRIAARQSARNVAVPKEDPDDEHEPGERIKTIIIILLAVIIGCLLFYFVGVIFGVFGGSESDNPSGVEEGIVYVPNVVGDDVADAQTALDLVDLKYEIEYVETTKFTHNQVIATRPEANTEVKSGSKVVIQVANNGGISLPSVVLYSEAEATASLEREGFKVVKEYEGSNEIIKGNVISQMPEGGSLLARGSEVVIVISLGRENSDITMPSLINMTEEAAKAKLEELGLVCASVSETYDDNVEKGLVCYQSYTEGATMDKGTAVDIKLSMGPEPRYYSCDLQVLAPPDYEGGVVNVVLKTPDGGELFNTTASSFPVAIKLTQIYGVSTGVVHITYTIYTEQEGVDAAGNPIMETVPAQNVYTYDVTFNLQNS